MKAFLLKSLLLTSIVLALVSKLSNAQSATFYACSENGFKLKGTIGFDEYEWSLDGSTIAGADSNVLPVEALSAETVGNIAILRNYSLKTRNANGCWSDEAVFAVHILPKISITTDGSAPPYCENMVQDINLTAFINDGVGTTALTLPEGVSINYEWSVVESGHPDCNASIITGTNSAIATVRTPAASDVANSYKLKVTYSYPAGVNIATEVVGNCNNESTETIYALPAPSRPTINYIHL